MKTMSAAVMVAIAAMGSAATIEELRAKAEKLVAQMTLEEKCGQLCTGSPAIERLGIPAYEYQNECLHGIAFNGRATVFPQPIGMASSFDPELVREIGDAISTEGRIKHEASVRNGFGWMWATGLTFWSPNVNILRDPRWGRGMETWGEDPYLTGKMGTAFVRGIQGDDPVYLKAAACAKHFAAHSGPEEGRHYFNSCPPKKDLFETYFPAFEMLVREGGVESVMGAYNCLYGESASASPFLLKKILREAWGFKGHIVSDYGAVRDIWQSHKLVQTPPEGSALAIRNGINFEAGSKAVHLKEGVEKGYVTEKEVDAALVPLLVTRLKLGIIGKERDPACPYYDIDPKLLCCERHRALARKMARESMVLMKNDGVLPLDPKKGPYGVAGAGATDVYALMGNYYGTSDRMVSYLDGISGAVDAGTSIYYRPLSVYGGDKARGHLPDATAVTFAVIGMTGAFEGENGTTVSSEFGGDRKTLDLPAAQLSLLELLQKDRKRGTKIVAIVTGGSPVSLKKVEELADAVVIAWYAGQEGGNALGDLLFGKADFTGRLPVTFPESVDVLPALDDYSMAGRTYRYQTKGIAYPFGYGLSYAKFAAGKIEKTSSADGEKVTVEMKNVSDRDGTAVVQLYVSTPNAGKGAPIKSLVGFRRVPLKAGESRREVFAVSSRQLVEFDAEGVPHPVTGTCTYSVQL